MPRKLVAGNWKMNGATGAAAMLSELPPSPGCDVLVCPPFPLIPALLATGTVPIGAQDCHWADAGAHTGDVSAPLLAELGVQAVILGHSERRADHGETSALVAAKVTAAHAAGLAAIVCIGETEAERDAGQTLEIVGQQLATSVPEGGTAETLVVAYEPVWAIGTGRTATPDQIGEVHAAIRTALEARFGAGGTDIRILYGGSVKPANAAEIFAVPHVDGALVGGASLKAADFAPIIEAAAS
ncbi:MAG: triose-phosphate isomerase [Pseudomonadota bacterium]